MALYRGEKSVSAYRLEIGDIRDIVHWTTSDGLQKDLQDTFQKGVSPGIAGYYGNVSRKELRDLFYKLGENKAEILGLMG